MSETQEPAPPEKEHAAFQEMKIRRLEAINETLRNELIMVQQRLHAMRVDAAADALINQRPD